MMYVYSTAIFNAKLCNRTFLGKIRYYNISSNIIFFVNLVKSYIGLMWYKLMNSLYRHLVYLAHLIIFIKIIDFFCIKL